MTANSVCSGWRFNIAIWWFVWLNRIDAICYAMLVLPGVLNILPHNGLSSLFGIEFESILLFVYLNPLFDRKFINLRLTWSFITFHLNCPLKWLMRRTYIVFQFILLSRCINQEIDKYGTWSLSTPSNHLTRSFNITKMWTPRFLVHFTLISSFPTLAIIKLMLAIA